MINEDVWNMAVEAHPELKGREDIKSSPKDFVMLIKIISEAKKAEENGNSSLSEYKNPDKGLQLIRETKSASETFSNALSTGSDNLMELIETPGYYAAQNLHENDFLPTDAESLRNLLNTHAPLEELSQVRNNLAVELIGNVYSHLNCDIRNEVDIKEMNNIIEQKPLSVLALIAVSNKNKDNGLPPVKIMNGRDLKAKLEMPQIKELASQIPLVNYGAAIKEAYTKAPLMEHMDKTRVSGISQGGKIVQQACREVG